MGKVGVEKEPSGASILSPLVWVSVVLAPVHTCAQRENDVCIYQTCTLPSMPSTKKALPRHDQGQPDSMEVGLSFVELTL